MRLSTTPSTAALLLALPSLAAAADPSWACTTVQDGIKYDLSSLKGTHQVFDINETPPTVTNTTWQINPCESILKDVKDQPKDQCTAGTYVCGLRWITYIADDKSKPELTQIIPVAGELGETHLKQEVTMLRSADQKPTGLKLVLHGGNYTREQRAVVDFVCDMERTGLETGEDKKDEKDAVEGSLKFVSYGNADDAKVDTLKLEWRTKVACEEFAKGGGDKGGGDKDGGKGETSNWGFFTWLFVILFLGVAAYLIFGSWLNYNRYGARGWDLLPHGDTIRDVPYLLKDFAKRVASTVQGRSSRGGYSAV